MPQPVSSPTARIARSDSGLGRGFATYRDYIFPRLTAFRMATLVEHLISGLQAVEQFLEDWLDFDRLRPVVQRFWMLFNGYRKDAATINRELLDWLSNRPQPEQPFFCFLNYFDAHWPYELRNKGIHRFGIGPRDNRESDLVHNWWERDKRGLSAQEIAFVRDSYDDCVADLDEQIGRLIDELGHRGVLNTTWVIVTADHGESFGEHAGVFSHGTSLYQTELHVPLVILPPAGDRVSRRTIKETVSLRDLAATIVDITGLKADTPFPGSSLARFWGQFTPPDTASPTADLAASGTEGVLAEVVPNDPLLPPDRQRWLESHWPLGALIEGGWSYIRRESGGQEELFHLSDDAREAHNLASDPATRPRLDQMRSEVEPIHGRAAHAATVSPLMRPAVKKAEERNRYQLVLSKNELKPISRECPNAPVVLCASSFGVRPVLWARWPSGIAVPEDLALFHIDYGFGDGRGMVTDSFQVPGHIHQV